MRVAFLTLIVSPHALAATTPCDAAIEGVSLELCVAYCEVLDCAAPEQLGDPACERALQAYQTSAGHMPPCVAVGAP